jgi:tetratricopeptide (TPR) repeat protein
MRTEKIFRLDWRARIMRLSLCAIIISMQGLALANSSWAAEPAWKTQYNDGEAALTRQDPGAAEQSFRKALELAESASASSADTEECMKKLASTLALRNKTAEAQSLYQKLLGLLVKRYGNNSQQIAPVLISLGSIQESLGDHSTAITYYQRALKINQKNYGPYSPAFAENLHVLGRANNKAGHRGQAVKQYKQSISILMQDPSLKAGEKLQSVMSEYTDLIKTDDNSDQSLIKDFDKDILGKPQSPANSDQPPKDRSPQPEKHSSIPANSGGALSFQQANMHSGQLSLNGSSVDSTPSDPNGLSALSTKHPDGGQPDSSASQSESNWQRQMMRQRDASGQAQSNEDPEVALRGLKQPWSDQTLSPAFKIVNDSIVNRARYDKGEDYYQRMIAIDIDALGPKHPSVANDLNGLAQLYISRKSYAQAEPLLIRAYEIYQQVYGMNNLLTINACASYALVESRLGHAARAEELYRTVLDHCQSALGPNSIETARALNELAHLYFYQGKLQESSVYYKQALVSTEGAVGQDSPLLAACLQDYARVLRGLGQNSEASALEGRAETILIGASGSLK